MRWIHLTHALIRYPDWNPFGLQPRRCEIGLRNSCKPRQQHPVNSHVSGFFRWYWWQWLRSEAGAAFRTVLDVIQEFSLRAGELPMGTVKIRAVAHK